jgi:ABC-2 type transport system permease protein
MTVGVVARKDFNDAVRSRSFIALSVLYFVLAGLVVYAYAEIPEAFVGEGGEPTAFGLAVFLAGVTSLFVALTAIVIANKALAGERELGSMKLLMALPHTRRDVVLGKLVGRTAVLVVPLAIAFSLAGVYGALVISDFALLDYAVFIGVTALFTLAYVSIVVGISASTGSAGRASALAVGFFLLFDLLWDAVGVGIVYVVNGLSFPATMPDWMYLVNNLSPSTAYSSALFALVPGAETDTGLGATAAEIDAFYGTVWLGVFVLLFWIVVPTALGYWRFNKADL